MTESESVRFSTNHALIKTKPDQFHIAPGHCRFNHEYRLILSKEDCPGLELSEPKTTLHSPYFPRREMEKIVSGFIPGDAETLLVLGCGLGYHLPLLFARFPGKRIVVIEPDKNLFNLALQQIDLAELPESVSFIIGYEDFEVSRLLTPLPPAFTVFEFKARTRLLPKYFETLLKRLYGQPVHQLSAQWKYPKFTNAHVRVLYIDSGYVLTKECLWAIDRLGHSFRYIHIDQDNYDYEAFIRGFMREVAEFKPDFVLTVNHLGFDREGRLTELLASLEIPYVSWYVDSPTVVLSAEGTNVSEWCSIFVWDRDYLDDVRRVGYPHVDYLPLAAMPDQFKPMPLPYTYDVSFVGSSMVFSTHKNLRSMVFRQDLLSRLDDVAREFLTLETRYVDHAIQTIEARGEKFSFRNDDQRADFEAAVLWRATQMYRLSGLLQLAPFYPTVFGDPNWDDILDERFRIEREVQYYDGLCELYNQTRVNFNMTSRQMKNAVNQRVFDVPACGRFLLSDDKAQIWEVFEPGEMVCFREVGEIPGLVRYYLDHETEREHIASKARERILQKDTYIHRLRDMIAIMRRRYAG